MVRCKVKLNTRLERKKLITGKPPVLDLEILEKQTDIRDRTKQQIHRFGTVRRDRI